MYYTGCFKALRRCSLKGFIYGMKRGSGNYTPFFLDGNGDKSPSFITSDGVPGICDSLNSRYSQVKTITVEKKINEIVNRLNKTKEVRDVDMKEERERRDRQEREDQKKLKREEKKQEKLAMKLKQEQDELR